VNAEPTDTPNEPDKQTSRSLSIVVAVSVLLLALVLAIPVVALFASVSLGQLGEIFATDEVQSAIWLSTWTSLISTTAIALLGTPAAYWFARSRTKLASTTELFLQLPLVLPPAVAGLALLKAFGSKGFAASLFGSDATIAFTGLAVIIAQFFVSAPIYIRSARSVFEQVPRQYEDVARTLGASPAEAFRRVVLPMSASGLLAAGALAWARAIGEFGATLLFAGNLPGVTQTMPTAIYVLLERNMQAAEALSVLLILLALGALAIVKFAQSRWEV
jgi:molybdate transport system permease protein